MSSYSDKPVLQLPVVESSGKDTGRQVTLNADIFGIVPNAHAVYLDIKQIMANRRQGTHKTKEKGEVHASTRKETRQKGLGRARRGSAKSPILKGGGRVFGPKPRSYAFKLNKKVKDLARKSALTCKAQDKHITVLQDIIFERPKTKQYLSMLTALNFAKKKTLLVLPKSEKHITLSSRNLSNAKVTTAEQLNTYDILDAQQLILSERALALLNERSSASCEIS